MGCSFSRTQRQVSRPLNPLQSREVTVTPGTFVKLNHSSLYQNYKELKKLGSGAFAQVYLCEHLPTGTMRALKKIHKAGLSSQQIDPNFLLKEIQILRSLDHPNILKCFEIFEDEDKFYISTEYCSGGDLFTGLLKKKKFDEASAAEIMFQLLSAVVYCHGKKIIHRDLKPENILVLDNTKSISIKVADFGSSCVIDNQRKICGVYGSAYYVAPEVLNDEYNEKCDLWSLGIIMYILLTGRPPYYARTSSKILEQIRSSPIVITPFKVLGLSIESVDLLKLLLEHDPEKRISSKEAISHPWIQLHRNHDLPNINIALDKLMSFNNESKLKEAVHIFLASQVISNSEFTSIRKNFQVLDKDGDGKLTKSELMAQYSKTMSISDAEKVVDEILERLDQDGDGMIDYTEFLVSCHDMQKAISREQLEFAFKMFDSDGSGTITVDEIKNTLTDGQIINEEAWHIILKEADANGDGSIDLKEFVNLMSQGNTARLWI